MKDFQEPVIEVIRFQTEEVVNTSTPTFQLIGERCVGI